MEKANVVTSALMDSILDNYIQIVTKRMEKAEKKAEELTVEEMYELNDDVRMLGHIRKLQSELSV
uniref:Uncharacterized protein n=1 Tax=Myoviridae sp. ctp7F23 TaxID=2825174 RepID=A0A8S5U8U4_9CAUD|nr:MAG TPA: hypothetical protein [Myoviridae sp. ctp7F23]